MKPLIVLLVTFLIALLVFHFIQGGWPLHWPGLIAMSAMLLLTALGHFLFTQGTTMMLPPFIPAKKFLVLLTGVLEITAAIGLLIPATTLLTAWCLLVFFLLILPTNVYAATKSIDIEKGTNTGPGLSYLWFRVPFQILLLVWIACYL